ARRRSTTLSTAVKHVSRTSIEREVSSRGSIEGVRMGSRVDWDNAVDGKIEWFAVSRSDRDNSCSRGRKLIIVQLHYAVDRVRVANHRQSNRVTLIDDHLIHVRENESEGPARGVVDNAELSDRLFGRVNVPAIRRDCESGGFSREGACGASDGLLAI